jgi:hypothetical protein
MSKKNRVILCLSAITIFVSVTTVAILLIAGERSPGGQISGAVSYPDPRWQYGQTDKVQLYDSTAHRLEDYFVPIEGGGSKFWYNMLIPPHPGHYYVHGEGENAESDMYYVYWPDTTAFVGQNVVMDKPVSQQK